MATTHLVLGTIDAVTGSIIVALIGAAGIVGARWAPKTRSEAAVERSSVRLNEAQALANTVDAQGRELTRAHSRVDELENALAEERRECDRRIGELQEELAEVSRELARFTASS